MINHHSREMKKWVKLTKRGLTSKFLMCKAKMCLKLYRLVLPTPTLIVDNQIEPVRLLLSKPVNLSDFSFISIFPPRKGLHIYTQHSLNED